MRPRHQREVRRPVRGWHVPSWRAVTGLPARRMRRLPRYVRRGRRRVGAGGRVRDGEHESHSVTNMSASAVSNACRNVAACAGLVGARFAWRLGHPSGHSGGVPCLMTPLAPRAHAAPLAGTIAMPTRGIKNGLSICFAIVILVYLANLMDIAAWLRMHNAADCACVGVGARCPRPCVPQRLRPRRAGARGSPSAPPVSSARSSWPSAVPNDHHFRTIWW